MDKGTQRWRSRTWLAHLAGGAFLIVGGVASLPLFVTGVLEKYRAQDWTETRARVTTARLAGTGGKSSLIFGREVELGFSYGTPTGQFYAEQEVSQKFAEDVGAAPQDRLIRRNVEAARPVPCWYDPAKPSQAVVERDLARHDFRALIPLVLVGFGVGVVVHGRRLVTRAAAGPAETLRLRNREGFEVTPLPDGGARCVPKPPAKRLSLAGITSTASPHPLDAVEVLDLPIRFGESCRFRVLLLSPAAGVTVDLQAGVPPRGLFSPGNVVWTERVTDASSGGSGDVVELELPDAGELPPGADDWWLRIVAEAGLAVHPPAFLLLPVESAAADAPASHGQAGTAFRNRSNAPPK